MKAVQLMVQYFQVNPGLIIFFINIHLFVRAIKLNCSPQSLLRVVIEVVFMSQFYIAFQQTRHVLKRFSSLCELMISC